jgi:hypothetical protein
MGCCLSDEWFTPDGKCFYPCHWSCCDEQEQPVPIQGQPDLRDSITQNFVLDARQQHKSESKDSVFQNDRWVYICATWKRCYDIPTELCALMLQYLCLACDTSDNYMYRRNVHLQTSWARDDECKETLKKCRYCHLSKFHHLYNRTPLHNNPIHISFAEIRCPINQCVACRRLMVKVDASNLCAECYVRDRSRPLRMRNWHPIDFSQFDGDRIPENLWCYQHIRQGRMVTDKRGKHVEWTTVRVLDAVASYAKITEYLESIEEICCVCQSKFRLPHLVSDKTANQGFPVCGFCVAGPTERNIRF